jgi:hypothetical protein
LRLALLTSSESFEPLEEPPGSTPYSFMTCSATCCWYSFEEELPLADEPPV